MVSQPYATNPRQDPIRVSIGHILEKEMAKRKSDITALLHGLRIYDLGRNLDEDTPKVPGHPSFELASVRDHSVNFGEDGRSVAIERLSFGSHSGTHIDALAHIAHEGHLYGGVPASVLPRGGHPLGADELPPVVCRGVLLDLPAALGIDSLAAGQPIRDTELIAASQRQGVEIGTGDAVLLRTGWAARHYTDPSIFLGMSGGAPGLEITGARWLAQRGISIVGSDTVSFEVVPVGTGLARMPVHICLLVENGIPIIEVMDLEELARDRGYEFVFIVAPIKISRSSGSPVRPLALV